MLLFVRGDEATVGKDDVCLDEIVDREPELAGHVTDTPAEREPAHAGRRNDPERRREPERLRRVVDLAEQRSAQHVRDAGIRIDDDAAQGGQVNHEPVVDTAESGTVVRATAHGDIESSLTGDIDRGDHVGCVDALSDQTRLLVDHRVVELPSSLVIGIARSDQPAAETGAQCLCELDIGRDSSSHSYLLRSDRDTTPVKAFLLDAENRASLPCAGSRVSSCATGSVWPTSGLSPTRLSRCELRKAPVPAAGTAFSSGTTSRSRGARPRQIRGRCWRRLRSRPSMCNWALRSRRWRGGARTCWHTRSRRWTPSAAAA